MPFEASPSVPLLKEREGSAMEVGVTYNENIMGVTPSGIHADTCAAETRALLDKAKRSFEAAESMLLKGFTDFAASRACYGCFYVAQALLLTQEHHFYSHAQALSLFTQSNLLDGRFHQLLARASEMRQLADYQAGITIEAEAAMDLIREGQVFLLAASRYLRLLA
jgi:uncharacterized protein (UPF0332 family)